MSKEIQTPRTAPLLDLGSGNFVAVKPGVSGQMPHRTAGVDICFVFDTTGSMRGKINGLIACMQGLVDDLGGTGLDWRVTVVAFGDLTVPGDRIVGDEPFVTDVQSAKHMLGAMPHFSGGGNRGESSIEAMLAACAKQYRADAVKVLVLLTDEPALFSPQHQPEHVHRALTSLDAVCFTVATRDSYYQRWANEHAGSWQQVGDSANTAEIIKMLRELLGRVVAVAESVQRLGAGSVRAYLEQTSR